MWGFRQPTFPGPTTRPVHKVLAGGIRALQIMKITDFHNLWGADFASQHLMHRAMFIMWASGIYFISEAVGFSYRTESEKKRGRPDYEHL